VRRGVRVQSFGWYKDVPDLEVSVMMLNAIVEKLKAGTLETNSHD
jgi:hypothetical protein